MLNIGTPRALGRAVAGVLAGAVLCGTAQADPAAQGKTLFAAKCALCHADTPIEGFGKSGPTLLGVVGRPAASVPGFAYTDALKASGLVWTPATLDVFLADPPRMVKGTVMPVAVTDPAQRQALIDYLKTLHR